MKNSVLKCKLSPVFRVQFFNVLSEKWPPSKRTNKFVCLSFQGVNRSIGEKKVEILETGALHKWQIVHMKHFYPRVSVPPENQSFYPASGQKILWIRKIVTLTALFLPMTQTVINIIIPHKQCVQKTIREGSGLLWWQNSPPDLIFLLLTSH